MIEVNNLVKRFAGRTAVDRLSFTAMPGEVLGFLGPNGAGKSTTMRVVCGYQGATSGTVRVAGFDVARQPRAVKSVVGYLPESAPCYDELTVTEFIDFSARIRGVSRARRAHAVEQAIERCFLGDVRRQIVGTLSKGYRHRTCLAQSIVHEPPVLVLDEPTDGLDPNQKHELRALIADMGRERTIVFSTHILEEVESVCDRAILVDRGRLVAEGTPSMLRNRARGAAIVELRLSGASSAHEARGALAALEQVAEVSVRCSDSCALRLQLAETANPDAVAARVAALATERRWALLELTHVGGRLDEFFREVTGADRSPREGKGAPGRPRCRGFGDQALAA